MLSQQFSRLCLLAQPGVLHMDGFFVAEQVSEAAADFRAALRYGSDVNGGIAATREGDGAK